MASWGANRPQKQAGRLSAAFAPGLTARTGQGSVLQWTIVGVVGILLGIYTMAVSSLPPQWAPLFVLAVLCPFIAVIVGNARKVLLAIIILDIPFQLDIHLGYRTEAAELGALGGWSLSVTTMALAVLYALWLAERLTKPPEPGSRPSVRASLPLALYFAFTALSVVVARDVTLATFEVFLALQMFLLYIYVVGTVRSRQDMLFIVTMLLISLILESVVTIGLGYVGQNFSIAGISSRIDVSKGAIGLGYRVAGTVGSPNVAASYLSLLLAPAISLLLTRLGLLYKWLAALAFGLGGVALILTLSRGGWVSFTFSITILCLLAWRRGWLPRSVTLTIGVVAVLLCLLFGDVIVARLLGDDLGSAQSRVPLMKLGLRVIMDNPVLGVGANNFPVVMKQYIRQEFGRAWLYAVHNKYLLVWAETGIGGLLAFIWFLLSTIRRGWRCWKLKDRFLSPLALGFTAAIAGQMAHMFLDVFRDRSQLQLLWLVAAVIGAMRNMDGEG